jgi:hypothetical protein
MLELNETTVDAIADAEYKRLLALAYDTSATNWEIGLSTIFALCKEAEIKCERVERFGSLPELVAAYRKAGGEGFPSMFMGRLHASYLANIDTWAKHMPHLDDEKELRAIRQANQASGVCWFPTDQGYAMACDGPSLLALDEDGNLHSPTGPAIAWPNGDSLFAWHGQFVPESWIKTPLEVDVKAVLETETNQELLRCLGEIIGFERVLAELDAEEVHKEEGLVGGTLYRVNLGGETRQLARVKCGTGRTFVLPVGDESTVVAALAATYGVSEATYRRMAVRT